jgi:hypothetical protein
MDGVTRCSLPDTTGSVNPGCCEWSQRNGKVPVLDVIFAFLCYQAVAHRRNPALHGGYLLATPLPLIMAVVTRLPLGLVAEGTPLPAAFHPGFNLAMVVTLACAAALWWWQPTRPAPFMTIGLATVMGWAGYYLAPSVPGWAAVGVAVGAAPTWLVGGIGFGIGALAMWWGWTAPRRARTVARAVA